MEDISYLTLISLTLPSLQEPKKVLSSELADIPDWFDIILSDVIML